jgi:hypothetical protein
VSYWQAARALQNGTLGDEQSWEFAKALGCAGDFGNAIVWANKAIDWANRTSDSGFSYNYVCLCCVAGADLDNCLSNLKAAFARDPSNVKSALSDPDLAVLRQKRSDAFKQLTAIQTDCDIQFGILNDDITLTNNSAFALTNVRVQFQAYQADPQSIIGRYYSTDRLTLSNLAPGATYTFSNCIQIHGSWVTSCHIVSLSCDEGELHR